MLRVGDAEIEHVAVVEVAALAEDPLRRRVVRLGVVEDRHRAVAAALGAKAGQRPRGLTDVLLRVALAEREQLHQLARVVLVGLLLRRVGERQEQQHRRVLRDVGQQAAEAAQRVAAQHLVLRELQRPVLVERREVVVPEERHLLDERARRADHLVQPPQHVMAVLVDRVQRLAAEVRLGEARPRRARASAQQPVDRLALAAARPVAQLLARRAEARAPEQALDMRLGPAIVVSSLRQR